jgi:hypothetical protein
MPIIVRFTTSADLLYRAQMAVLRSIGWMRWGGIFVGVILPTLIVALQLISGRTLQAAFLSELGWIVGLPAAWFMGIPLAQRRGASRTFNTMPAAQGERVYTFAGDDIMLAGGLSSGVLNWKAIVRVVETPDLFLLFLSGQVAHFIPQSAFASEADVSRFRTLVAEKVDGRPAQSLTA